MIDARPGDPPRLAAKRVRWRKESFGFLLHDAATDRLFEGNQLGAQVLALIDGERSVREIAAAVSPRYGVDRGRVEADVADFVEAMRRAELLADAP
ncbi:MAG: PqqD family protein [Armatimonadota bacterium]